MGERIPAWSQRVVQDPDTHIFSAQVWEPKEEYKWKQTKFKPETNPLLIYECHIGSWMKHPEWDGREDGFYTYREFAEKIAGFKSRLAEINAKGAELDRTIAKALDSLNFNPNVGKC